MIELTDLYRGKTRRELENIVSDYYRDNFQGKCVINKSINEEICFNAIGRSKTSFGGQRLGQIMSSHKATAITVLDKLIEDATFTGSTPPKSKHIRKYRAISFLNFAISCKIDNIIYDFKIAAMVRRGGKIHYSISEDYHI